VNKHVDRVLSNCAQSVFALKTLRAHGLNRECLHNVVNAVILAKLTYAVSAWIGFTGAGERKKSKHLSVAVNVLNCVPQKQKLLQKSVMLILPCDAMDKRGLCQHAVSVCPSVTFVSCAKTNKDIFKNFSPSSSHGKPF